MAETTYDPILTPTAFYKDPKAALNFLEAAFGFEVVMLIENPDGGIAHLEMAYRGAVIGIGGEWEFGPAKMRSPQTLGATTQFIWLSVEKDIEALCERARKAGAQIAQEPEDQFYGARTFRALDPEGHVWAFSQTMRSVPQEEMEKATGLVWKKG